MSNVVPFVRRRFLEVCCGTVTDAHHSLSGELIYWVSLVSAEGEVCVWSGFTHDEALKAAERLQAGSWDNPHIRDCCDEADENDDDPNGGETVEPTRALA